MGSSHYLPFISHPMHLRPLSHGLLSSTFTFAWNYLWLSLGWPFIDLLLLLGLPNDFGSAPLSWLAFTFVGYYSPWWSAYWPWLSLSPGLAYMAVGSYSPNGCGSASLLGLPIWAHDVSSSHLLPLHYPSLLSFSFHSFLLNVSFWSMTLLTSTDLILWAYHLSNLITFWETVKDKIVKVASANISPSAYASWCWAWAVMSLRLHNALCQIQHNITFHVTHISCKACGTHLCSIQ